MTSPRTGYSLFFLHGYSEPLEGFEIAHGDTDEEAMLAAAHRLDVHGTANEVMVFDGCRRVGHIKQLAEARPAAVVWLN